MIYFSKKENGISDTKNVLSIGLIDMDDSELFPLITERTEGNIKQYFLCDFVKIWQHKIKEEIND